MPRGSSLDRKVKKTTCTSMEEDSRLKGQAAISHYPLQTV